MMPYLQQAVHDLFYGNPQEKAARKAAAAQAAAQAAAERQRRDEATAQREEAIKNQLLGIGAADSTSLSLMGDATTLTCSSWTRTTRPTYSL